MKNLNFFLIHLVLIFSLVRCASAGKIFNYQNKDQIVLDETNLSEALRLLGNPLSREVKSNKNGNFEILNYVYAKANASGASARVLMLEFKNDTLNAKIYNSGFKEDQTEFTYEEYKNIKVGISNKNDVLNYLGNPSGIGNCPSTIKYFPNQCEKDRFFWLWIHTSKSRGYNISTIKSKSIVISFDDQWIVTGVETSKEL